MAKPKTERNPKIEPSIELPLKPLLNELDELRRTLRELIESIGRRLEAQIAQLHAAITAGTTAKRLPAARAHDIREMLMLVRRLDLKPAKGRRRDLKKLEGAVEELRRVVEGWEE